MELPTTSMVFSAVMDGNMRVLRTESGLDPEAAAGGGNAK
jgi:hypothetical protein